MVTAWNSCKAIWALHIEPDQDPITNNGIPDPEIKKTQWVGMASIAITTSGSGHCKETDSVANEITIPADVMLKRKSEQEKTNEQESDKQLTCPLNDMTQSPQLGVAIGKKIGLA